MLVACVAFGRLAVWGRFEEKFSLISCEPWFRRWCLILGAIISCLRATNPQTPSNILYTRLKMLLGLPEALPKLVEAKFASALSSKSLIFSHTELTIIRTTTGVPVSKYSPSIAYNPLQLVVLYIRCSFNSAIVLPLRGSRNQRRTTMRRPRSLIPSTIPQQSSG